jgi:hypothetical protein
MVKLYKIHLRIQKSSKVKRVKVTEIMYMLKRSTVSLKTVFDGASRQDKSVVSRKVGKETFFTILPIRVNYVVFFNTREGYFFY